MQNLTRCFFVVQQVIAEARQHHEEQLIAQLTEQIYAVQTMSNSRSPRRLSQPTNDVTMQPNFKQFQHAECLQQDGRDLASERLAASARPAQGMNFDGSEMDIDSIDV